MFVSGAAALNLWACRVTVSWVSATVSVVTAAGVTAEPDKMGGRPCIRGMRIRVQDILEMLAGGMSNETILADFDYLELDDIRASLAFAA